jgi:hypothetical protein
MGELGGAAQAMQRVANPRAGPPERVYAALVALDAAWPPTPPPAAGARTAARPW